MYNKQFSIAALMVAGLFATGCSQQTTGGSQVSGGSQSQIEGGSQVAGSQQAGSQQQVDDTVPVVTPKSGTDSKPVAGNCHTHAANSMTKTIRHCHPNPTGKHRYGGRKHTGHRGGRWVHSHPAVPGCTKSIRHAHKYKNARHSHHYSCKGKRRHVGGNRWTHTHPAVPACTKSIRHTHKYNSAHHSHHYSCKRGARPTGGKVDVYALQRKLKAKGYYKGPIDGVVGEGTRSALKRFMNR